MLDSNIIPTLLGNYGSAYWVVTRLTVDSVTELAKYGMFSDCQLANAHREADDSRNKMLDSNLVAAVQTKLADEDGDVCRSALRAIAELARHGTLSAFWTCVDVNKLTR